MSKLARDKNLSAYSNCYVNKHVKIPVGINKPDRKHSNRCCSSVFVEHV